MSVTPTRPTIAALAVFLLLSITHLIALLAGWEPIAFWTKPFLMPLVAVTAILAGRPRFGRVGLLLSAALLCSTVGDIALLSDGSEFFVAGLSAFLLAHLIYIAVFWHVAQRALPRWWSLIFAAWFGLLMVVLVPHLGSLLVPVVGYGIVIATMTVVSTRCAPRVIVGATLFLLSDSILAVNRFVPNAGLWEPDFVIMLTYIAAQAVLAWGLIGYFSTGKTRQNASVEGASA